MGYTVNASAFYLLTPAIWVGGRVAYDYYWWQLGGTVVESGYYRREELEANRSAAHVAASLRLVRTTLDERARWPSRVFACIGIGPAWLGSAIKYRIKENSDRYEWRTIDTDTKVVLDAGAGVQVGYRHCVSFEVVPLVHLVGVSHPAWREHYFSCSINFVFGSGAREFAPKK